MSGEINILSRTQIIVVDPYFGSISMINAGPQGPPGPPGVPGDLAPSNVLNHGAIGDGIHDDTVAIQSTINSAPTGSAVYLPAGTYKISAALSMGGGGNLGLVGAGYRATKLVLANGANTSMITTPDDGVQRYGLLIRDLAFDGNAQFQTGTSPAIRIRGWSEAKLENLYILNPRGDGISIGQATAGIYCTVPHIRGLIMRGDVLYSQGSGIRLDSGSSDAMVLDSDIGFFPIGAGIVVSGHNGYLFESVNVWQCRYGFQAYRADRGRFVGCLSDYAKYHGFICQESDILQFVGCQARESSQTTPNTYDGFHFEGVAGTPAGPIGLSNCWSVGAQARVGVALQNDINGFVADSVYVNGNAVAPIVIGSGISNHKFVNCAGVNPSGGSITTPAFPATTVAVNNTTGVDVTAYVKAGTAPITQITIGGVATDMNIAVSSWGTVRIPANQTIAFTYASGTPTWKWNGD